MVVICSLSSWIVFIILIRNLQNLMGQIIRWGIWSNNTLIYYERQKQMLTDLIQKIDDNRNICHQPGGQLDPQ